MKVSVPYVSLMILNASEENGASSFVSRVTSFPFGSLPTTGGMSSGEGR